MRVQVEEVVPRTLEQTDRIALKEVARLGAEVSAVVEAVVEVEVEVAVAPTVVASTAMMEVSGRMIKALRKATWEVTAVMMQALRKDKILSTRMGASMQRRRLRSQLQIQMVDSTTIRDTVILKVRLNVTLNLRG